MLKITHNLRNNVLAQTEDDLIHYLVLRYLDHIGDRFTQI